MIKREIINRMIWFLTSSLLISPSGKTINSYTIRIIEYCIEAVTNILDRIVLDH